jgi:hypothetical protein
MNGLMLKDLELTEEIESRERRLAQAEQTGDVAALWYLIAADFNGVNAHGQRVDRTGFIAEFTAPHRSILSLRLESVSIHFFEKVGLVTGSSNFEGIAFGRAFHEHYHFMDVWVRRSMHWQLIASHVSRADP